jgi:hypothetical protein
MPPLSFSFVDSRAIHRELSRWLFRKELGPGLRGIAETRGTWTSTITLPPTPMLFVSVASKGLKYCASPLFATHTRGPEVLHLKGLCCTKTVHIVASRRWAQTRMELAAIVPRSYCTRGIWARQEEKARRLSGPGGVSNWINGVNVADVRENWTVLTPVFGGRLS